MEAVKENELSADEVNKMFYDRIEVSEKLESGYKFCLLLMCVSAVVLFAFIHQIVYSEILRLIIDINMEYQEPIGVRLLMLTYAKYVSVAILVGLVVATFCLFCVAKGRHNMFPERRSKIYKALWILSLIMAIFASCFVIFDVIYRVMFLQLSDSVSTLRSTYAWFGGDAVAVCGSWLTFSNAGRVKKIMDNKKLEPFKGEF